MKTIQKFLTIFAVVIICLGGYTIISRLSEYKVEQECMEKVIAVSQILFEENYYGEAIDETKQNKYYNFIQSERKQKYDTAKSLMAESGEDTGLKLISDAELAVSYQYVADENTPRELIIVAKLLIWSLFISFVILCAITIKYKKLIKYLISNVLIIFITLSVAMLCYIIANFNSILVLGDKIQNFIDIEYLLPFGMVYVFGLITNIKVNQGASFRMNIIYAVFALLTSMIVSIHAVNVYLVLAVIDVIYNSIKLKNKTILVEILEVK